MSLFYDFFLDEYKEKGTNVRNLLKNVKKFQNKYLKNGSRFAENYANTCIYLLDIQKIIHTVPLFIEYFHLVPNDVATKVIELYKAYEYENKSKNNNFNKYKNFKRVHLIILFYFANAYGQYLRLDKYIPLCLSTSQQFLNNTSIDYNVINDDEKYVFHSYPDIIFQFQKMCISYDIDTIFMNECIKIINPLYNEKFHRIKKVAANIERAEWIKEAYLRKFKHKPFESSEEKTIKHLKSLHRNKFR